jgi:ABC-type nitrate/sulfonate/bicarbonate transport system substrate-binding protein
MSRATHRPELRWAKRRKLRWLAVLAVLGLVAAACGSGDDAGGSGDGERSVIRFAFAPDPVWDYMNDNGMIVEWEEKFNTRIVTSSTWDEFAFFAGGHGDIVSTATYELPLLEKETDIKTVTFGQYNHLRVPMMARPESNYETLEDIPKGSKIGVIGPVSSTLVWGFFADKLHGLNFRVGEGDYELVVEDYFVMPELLVRGDVEAIVCIPEAAAPYLRRGEIEVMYGGETPWELYQEIGPDPEHKGVMGNMFTSTEEWFEENEDLAAAFLELWQSGIDKWHENQAEIISTYPQHFAVEEEADVEFIQQYIEDHDWFVDTVYLDEDWIEAEMSIYDLMKETGFMEESDPTPRFEAVEAPS